MLHSTQLKDIQLCAMAISKAGDKLSRSWKYGLLCLGGIRRWVFLPCLALTIPTLVMFHGGDALSVCFNSIVSRRPRPAVCQLVRQSPGSLHALMMLVATQAVLFLCEIDNVAYRFALGERVRSRVETAGRLELTDDEKTALVRTKQLHLPTIAVYLPVAVKSAHPGTAFSLGLLVFWLGGVAEAFVPTSSRVEIFKQVLKATVAWCLGLLTFSLLWGLSTVI